MSLPKLSVVIATFNRAETLRETIAHIANQDIDPGAFELIVVDDGSPDDTPRVVEELARSARFKLEYRRHANAGPGYTQNRGLELATAPLVLLMADDIWMSPGALTAHIDAHVARPGRNIVVLGRVIQSPRLSQSVFLRKWDPFRFSRFDGQTQLPYYRFWACNISAKRDFLLNAGGFREHRGRAGPASHEDPEFGYRLHKLGMQLFYNELALGYHYHLVSLENACRRKYESGLNFAEFQSYVPEPEIAPAYRVMRLRTLSDHLQTWTSARRQYLSPSDRNPLAVIVRHLARAFAFNRITVPWLWEPLARGAERNRWLAALANSEIYRGLLFHYFLEGCRDADRKFPRSTPRIPPPVAALSALSMGAPPSTGASALGARESMANG